MKVSVTQDYLEGEEKLGLHLGHSTSFMVVSTSRRQHAGGENIRMLQAASRMLCCPAGIGCINVETQGELGCREIGIQAAMAIEPSLVRLTSY